MRSLRRLTQITLKTENMQPRMSQEVCPVYLQICPCQALTTSAVLSMPLNERVMKQLWMTWKTFCCPSLALNKINTLNLLACKTKIDLYGNRWQRVHRFPAFQRDRLTKLHRVSFAFCAQRELRGQKRSNPSLCKRP